MNCGNVKTNKFFNGETVSYTLMASVSVFLFFLLKQLFKITFGIGASVSALIAFIAAEVIFYLLEKRFVFRKNVLSSNLKQIFLFMFRCAVNFGFYKLSEFIFGNILKMEVSFFWMVAITICFFFNYFFDRLITFDCAYDSCSIKRSKIYLLFYYNRFIAFSGFLALICLFAIFIGYSCFPFGDYTIMRMDLYHQYGPLFAELYERVVNGNSLIYSWFSGGGSSFIGNYFNYLSSPLTGLIFLFDKENISQAITVIVTVKCVLSASAFTAYLKYSLGKSNYITAAFGVLYSFCAYFLAYYWNVMWLDGMILLPFVILGIENIINKKNCVLYIASLAVLLYSSYYIGFMTCIFSVLYFFGYMIITSGKSSETLPQINSVKKKFTFKYLMKNRFFNRIVKFGISSIIAGGLCAFALVPVYFILTNSSATSDNFPDTFNSYFNIFDFITSNLAGLETTIRSSGEDVLPNVYSGIIVLILLPLYIVNKDIKFKEKFVYICLLLFFLFSFDNNIMNYLWHAMHFPNDLPYRYSYMYTFIVLVMSYKSLLKLKSLNVKDVCYVAMSWVFFICVAQKMSTEKMSEITIYLSIGFVIIWAGFLYYNLVNKKKNNKQFVSFLAVVLVFVEVITADISAFTIGQKNSSYTENYADYTEAIDIIHNDDEDFYREELTSINLRMDPCYYSYNGMSTFSSMAYADYSQLQYSLGLTGNRINSYSYRTQTAIYNMMFNLKYLIETDEGTNPDSHLFEYYGATEKEGTKIFKNKYYLPIAYCASNNLENWIVEEGNPFKVQEDYFELATGFDGVFNTVQFLSTEFDAMYGDNVKENGTWWFYSDNEDSYGNVSFSITPVKSGNLYLCISSPDIEFIDIDSENFSTISHSLESLQILDLGYFEAGEIATVTLNCQYIDTDETYADIYAYTLDEEIFERGYNKLKETSMEITDYTETTIEGTVNAKEDCYLYSSIPYDDGWTIKIDGEKCDTFAIGNDSMLTTAIKKGEHTVELTYSPKGINYGAAITIFTVLGICGYVVYKKITSKRKDNKPIDNYNITSV